MRRLNPNLVQWFRWIAAFAVVSCFGLLAPKMLKIVNPENDHEKLWRELASILTPLGGFSLMVGVFGSSFLCLAWVADSVKISGWNKTFFLDPALADRNKKRLQGRPRWRFFFLRATAIVGLSMFFASVMEKPLVRGIGPRSMFLHGHTWLLIVFVVLFLMIATVRYYLRRNENEKILSLESPELFPFLLDPALLFSLTPPKLQLDRERRIEDWWNLTVLAQCRLEAEGKLANGTTFSIMVEHRIPWFRAARLAAAIRIYATKSGAAAIVSAKDSMIFPAEAAVDVEPVLGQVRAFLLRHDSSFIVITSQYIHASLPRISNVTEAFEAVWLGLRVQANLQAPRDGGYRGDSPLAATPAQMARITAIADEAWAAFPSKPRGPQP